MEQELAIKLQDNGITYLDLAIAGIYSFVWSRVVQRPGTLLLAWTLQC